MVESAGLAGRVTGGLRRERTVSMPCRRQAAVPRARRLGPIRSLRSPAAPRLPKSLRQFLAAFSLRSTLLPPVAPNRVRNVSSDPPLSICSGRAASIQGTLPSAPRASTKPRTRTRRPAETLQIETRRGKITLVSLRDRNRKALGPPSPEIHIDRGPAFTHGHHLALDQREIGLAAPVHPQGHRR